MASLRPQFVLSALIQWKKESPYIWGAKGKPLRPGVRAFDCSGLVTWCLKQVGGPDWCINYNVDRLWAECTPTKALRSGTLVFYGPMDDPSHVMISVGEGAVVGASGGGHMTVVETRDAYVKAFPTLSYRPDYAGLRELPLGD